jgi:type 1 glutamine amidotransferase
MRDKPPTRPIAGITLAAALGASLLAPAPAAAQAQPKFKALMYWQAGDFFHNSTHYVKRVWRTLAAKHNFVIDSSNAATAFTAANLRQYQCVIWINNTKPGNVLNPDQKAAWFEYIKTGGYLGMHAATDAVGTWPEYIKQIGGELSVHSPTEPATMNVDTGDFARNHPIVKEGGLPSTINFREEWYSFRTNPRLDPEVKVLYTLDEKTFHPGVVMGDHPIVWVKEIAPGGRIVYMGMGHEDNVFKPELDQGYAFVEKIMLSSLLWAAKQIPASTGVNARPGDAPGFSAFSSGPRELAVQVSGSNAAADYRVEVARLDGRRVALKQSKGETTHAFANLPAAGLYTVALRNSAGIRSQLVMVR